MIFAGLYHGHCLILHKSLHRSVPQILSLPSGDSVKRSERKSEDHTGLSSL